MNAIAILFSDDLERAQINMSEHVQDIILSYRNEQFEFTKRVGNKKIVISVHAEEYDDPLNKTEE